MSNLDPIATKHRPASAVVVTRPGADGRPELLFVKRPVTMRFLAGFHAFVGGAVHDEDSHPDAIARAGISLGDAAAAMGSAAGEYHPVSFFIAALRELFEEVGILFVKEHVTASILAEARRRLVGGETTFPEMLRDLGLQLDARRLRYHERWIAPEALPVRFDLRVFVADLAAAKGHLDPDPNEVERIDWLSCAQALTSTEMGAVMMAPPTTATVNSLARFESVHDLVTGTGTPLAENPVQRHSASVRRLVAPNPSMMTGPGTNVYIVGTTTLVIIDPGSMEPEHVRRLASLGDVSAVVLTHGHPDHLSGALDLAQAVDAPLMASARFWELSKLSQRGRRLSDGDMIEVEGIALRVLETPGHSSDHICLWDETQKSLFCGDLLLGQGTAVISPPDGNLVDYLGSLNKVLALEPKHLYPGHFSPRDDAEAWIVWYIEHRQERERQIVAAVDAGATTPTEIVAVVYKDVAEMLHPLAERSVLAHLIKLGLA
ncbi:MAG: MBL fold metallo-hydrolase [Actinomycetota bacterium]